MIRELTVKNVAVVAEARVELGPGLNALTGETGAGKSIVVDALALLAGARASADLVRSGAESLVVTGLFEPAGDEWRGILEEAGLEALGEELLIRREVAKNGRNRVFINDQPATARLLTELGPALLRIHGQRDELGLAEADFQREWLDLSGGPDAAGLLAAVSATYDKAERLASRLERLSGDAASRRERLELLRLMASELDRAHLEAGEEERLRTEREQLRHHEAIEKALGGSFALLVDDEDSAAARLARAEALLAAVTEVEPGAAPWVAELAELRIRLEELGRELAAKVEGIDATPGRLDAVEDRLALVERLLRRYGGSSEAALARRAEIAVEIEELDGDTAGKEELEAELGAALDSYREAALALSAARAGWAVALARRIEKHLADLGLAKARFTITLGRRSRQSSALLLDGVATDFGRTGIDQVVFELAANPGEPAGPLAKVASGGELARIYLALQVAVGREKAGGGAVLVFDEVDAGVGGAQASALGKKLQRLATGGQLLVVTHLPQVASCADHHFKVGKREKAGRTLTEVAELGAEARVDEIARMLAGSRITDLSRSHASELLASSSRRRS